MPLCKIALYRKCKRTQQPQRQQNYWYWNIIFDRFSCSPNLNKLCARDWSCNPKYNFYIDLSNEVNSQHFHEVLQEGTCHTYHENLSGGGYGYTEARESTIWPCSPRVCHSSVVRAANLNSGRSWARLPLAWELFSITYTYPSHQFIYHLFTAFLCGIKFILWMKRVGCFIWCCLFVYFEFGFYRSPSKGNLHWLKLTI